MVFLRTELTNLMLKSLILNPFVNIFKNKCPGSKVTCTTPTLRFPWEQVPPEIPFRMRHHHQYPTIGGGETRQPWCGTVWIMRIRFRRPALQINKPQNWIYTFIFSRKLFYSTITMRNTYWKNEIFEILKINWIAGKNFN